MGRAVLVLLPPLPSPSCCEGSTRCLKATVLWSPCRGGILFLPRQKRQVWADFQWWLLSAPASTRGFLRTTVGLPGERLWGSGRGTLTGPSATRVRGPQGGALTLVARSTLVRASVALRRRAHTGCALTLVQACPWPLGERAHTSHACPWPSGRRAHTGPGIRGLRWCAHTSPHVSMALRVVRSPAPRYLPQVSKRRAQTLLLLGSLPLSKCGVSCLPCSFSSLAFSRKIISLHFVQHFSCCNHGSDTLYMFYCQISTICLSSHSEKSTPLHLV